MTATAEDKIIADIELTEAAEAALTAAPADAPGESTGTAPAALVAETAAAIRIVKGNPTDEEVAALVSVLAAAASEAGAPEGDGKPPETWGDPTRMHRQWAPFSPYSYPNLG